MLVLLCFCVATEFSVNKDLYKPAVWNELAPDGSRDASELLAAAEHRA